MKNKYIKFILVFLTIYLNPYCAFSQESQTEYYPVEYSFKGTDYLIRSNKKRFSEDTLTNAIYRGDYDGIYVAVKTKLFYTTNGFQKLPSVISVIINEKGNLYMKTWLPYCSGDAMYDASGVAREAFGGFYNDQVEYIIDPPDDRLNGRSAERRHPLFSSSGWYEIEKFGWWPSLTWTNDTIKKEKIEFKGFDRILFKDNIKGSSLRGQTFEYKKIVNLVNDENVIYSLNYVLQTMLFANEKAGKYISQSARDKAAGGELIRQSIINDYYKER